MKPTNRRFKASILALGAAFALALVACSGDSKPAESSPIAVKPTEATQGGTTPQSGTASQGGTTATTNSRSLFPSPAPPPDPASIPSTFNPKPGDLVFVTNASISYNSQAKFPWVIIIDAKTKKIVAGAEIPEISSSPHGVGVSPDGTRIYIPAGSALPNFQTSAAGIRFSGGVTVVDMKTLKTIQQIDTKDAPHHIQTVADKYVMVDAWGTNQILFLLDPNDNNRIVKEFDAASFGGRPYIGFPSPDEKYIYMTVRPEPNSGHKESWISRISLADWTIEKVADVGGGAVWVGFSRDGQYAYVTEPEEDRLAKVDLLTGKVVGRSATGRGPYGVNVSPDESTLLVVSKGEGGRGQRGGSFVTIEADTMRLLQETPSCLAFVCQPDHAIISPDGTEYWINNNMGYVDAFDIETMDLLAEVTMPFLADPHGGVFVQFDKDGKGHVVMEPGGPRGGVSPYEFDNAHGVPTLAQALKDGWKPAESASALVLGAKVGSGAGSKAAAALAGPSTTVNLVMDDFFFAPFAAVPLSRRAGRSPSRSQTRARPSTTSRVTQPSATSSPAQQLQVKAFDVGALKEAELTFKAPAKPGEYHFTCTYHPKMDGVIIVK